MQHFLRLSALFALFIFAISAQAQRPSGGSKGERPSIGVVSGKVLDAQSQQAVEYATIALFSLRDSSYTTGGVTDGTGNFKIEEIKLGRYRLEVSFIGYDSYTSDNFMLSPKQSIQKNMGTIQLNRSKVELEEAVIDGAAPAVAFEIDKKIYHVEQLMNTSGEDANAVLQQLPSVDVDLDGQISLRGSSNVTVLIDGRPSGLSGDARQALLDQLPASQIERVEVVTQPGAKYDAEGMAGIINVVLKKNKRIGTNGFVRLSLGTFNNYNASVGANQRTDKRNTSLNYSFRYSERDFNKNTFRPFLETELGTYQEGLDNRHDQSHTLKFSHDQFLSDSLTLGFGLTGNIRMSEEEGLLQYFSTRAIDERVLIDERFTDETNANQSADAFIYIKKTLGNREHFWETELTGSVFDGDREQLNTQGDSINRNFNLSPNIQGQWRFDYAAPLQNNWEIEAGTKAAMRLLTSDTRFENFVDNEWVVNDFVSNNFEFDEYIFAAYASAGKKWERFSAKGGLRAEHTVLDIRQITQNISADSSYTSLFPSVYLSYKLNENWNLQSSYVRRINRPRGRQLNPFTDFSDQLNIRRGNPSLRPEYVNNAEAQIEYSDKTKTISLAVYGSQTNDVIRRFFTVEDSVSVFTYQNFAQNTRGGSELVFNYRPSRKLTLTASSQLYYTFFDTSNLEGDFNQSAFGAGAKASATYNLNSWSFQSNGRYRSPQDTPQGFFSGFTSIDATVKKQIWEGKGDISLRVSDVFNTREFSFSTQTPIESEGYRKRQSRFVYLNFSYRFGKQERSRGRGKNSGGGFDGGDMDF